MVSVMASNRFIVKLILLSFFILALFTNVMGPIVPDIINAFHLSLRAAGLLVFSFFIAYGVMSIPAGMLVERFTEKPVLIGAFTTATLGALGFSLFPRYEVAIGSLFVIGASMATLQVAINPLLRIAGGAAHFAFNEVLAQLVFGFASFASSRVYSYLVLNLSQTSSHSNGVIRLLKKITPVGLPWLSLYWLLALCAFIMALIVLWAKFPITQGVSERHCSTAQMYRRLLRRRAVWMYFFSIFAYVGFEQGTADWISKFLSEYQHCDPHTTGALVVSSFWGLMTVGCLFGVFLLRLFDSRRILVAASTGALVSFSVGLFGSSTVSVAALPLVGLFASVMWPILISLALNSVAEYHSAFSGLLGAGIIGGAIMTVTIGWLGDHFGLRTGMALLYINLAYILSVGFWATPLINNHIFRLKKEVVIAPASP